MKRKDGFTLAEVLITLTIIGVISALTLPAIQSNTAASRNRAALKKAMAALSQAAMNNMATEGWNFAHLDTDNYCFDNGRNHNAMDDYTVCGLLNSNLVGETYLGSVTDGRPQGDSYRVGTGNNGGLPGSGEWFVSYQLADGVIVGLEASAKSCTEAKRTNDAFSGAGEWCGGYIDVNGFTGPHRAIRCTNNTVTYLWEDEDATCEVERTTNADLFPIVFYDNTVELASDAARAFLNAR